MSVKKILALLLAAMMVFGMTSAMADLGSDATGAETGVYEGNSTTIPIKTAVIITNNEEEAAAGKVVNYPAMSFTHSIAPATLTAGTDYTVTDEHGVTVDVKPGVAGGASITETGITADKVTLNANGQEVVFATSTVTVDLSAYTAPGIYRYAITDTSTETGSANLTALEGAGVVKGASIDDTYFLDIYIKRDTTTNTLTVAGAVLSSENTETITHDANDKESGFDEVKVITETTTDPDTQQEVITEKLDPSVEADLTKNYSYTTYNVTLTKAVKGSMGDQDHAFPFAVAVTSAQNYGYEVTGSHATSHNVAYVSDTTVSNVSLDDGATLKIWGLAPFATVNYTETNDTSSTYKVKVGKTSGTDNLQTETDVAANGTKVAFTKTEGTGSEAVTSAQAKNVTVGYAINATATINDGVDATHFTNTLEDISPTGVALRFGPYLAMFAAGCVLFLILATKRSKKEEE